MSLISVRVEVLAENTEAHLTWASGAFIKRKNKFFLVTNWHVVSGRNFQTNQPLHSSGSIPGFLNIHFAAISERVHNGFKHAHCSIILDLYDSTIENGEEVFSEIPNFLIHPEFGSKVDIAVIDITEIVEKQFDKIEMVAFDLDKELQKNVTVSVMDDVFVIGYPLKSNTTPNEYPIYKNATIASEPDAFESLPIFYIDGKTKSGMSGSPVVRRKKLELKDENTRIKVDPERTDFIGIYSGRDRQEADEYQAELGIVWNLHHGLLPIIELAFS